MDKLTRGTALAGAVRIFCCRTTELVQDATNRHQLAPTSAAALGRTLSVGCMMGTMLKTEKEKLEIQIDGKGPLGQMVVDAYYDGSVRGYVTNPNVFLEREDHHLDVGKAVGTDGVIRVIKDLSMKQPFVSEVAIQTGEIGEDFAYYYAESEQTPSAVSVGVLVDKDCSIKAAGGLIIQMMPSAVDSDIDYVENIVQHLKPISQLIEEYNEPTEIVKAIFNDYEEMETRDLQFKCECSRGKFAAVIAHLPKEDLEKMINEDGGCEVKCWFCGKTYYYEKETLQGYVAAIDAMERAAKYKAQKENELKN